MITVIAVQCIINTTFCDDYYNCCTVYYKHYSASNILTSYGSVLVKLAVPQLVKKFPTFYGT